MRLTISGYRAVVLVIAEPFEIEGSEEKFAVHRTYGDEQILWYGEWTATHVETGFRVGAGATCDDAIAAARRNWAERTPQQLEDALRFARITREARTSQGREVLQ